jgi:hypothetical protein
MVQLHLELQLASGGGGSSSSSSGGSTRRRRRTCATQCRARGRRWLEGDVSGAERVGALGGVLGSTTDADGALGALGGSGALGWVGVRGAFGPARGRIGYTEFTVHAAAHGAGR